MGRDVSLRVSAAATAPATLGNTPLLAHPRDQTIIATQAVGDAAGVRRPAKRSVSNSRPLFTALKAR